jgi:hypothetical protein
MALHFYAAQAWYSLPQTLVRVASGNGSFVSGAVDVASGIARIVSGRVSALPSDRAFMYPSDTETAPTSS